MKTFYWQEETLDYFHDLKATASDSEYLKEVEDFIVRDCQLEDGETHEDLFKDLLKQVEGMNK